MVEAPLYFPHRFFFLHIFQPPHRPIPITLTSEEEIDILLKYTKTVKKRKKFKEKWLLANFCKFETNNRVFNTFLSVVTKFKNIYKLKSYGKNTVFERSASKLLITTAQSTY